MKSTSRTFNKHNLAKSIEKEAFNIVWWFK